ncbi:hypothetical protein VO54_03692 [Elizabethkingia miricola]|nr:hypothetical protein VO54_03692 [Elizabethkingia miricola]
MEYLKNMGKRNYFKIGASAYMLLGALHLFYQFSKQKPTTNLMLTYTKMKETSFDFMGEHTLMQFYTGFSIMMGLMLFAFGFQAFMIKQPNRSVVIVNILISLTASILAVIYFHPLAYSFLLCASLCFILCLINSGNRK